MRRIDRLLLMVEEEARLDTLQVSNGFVYHPEGKKWQAIIDLWDGVPFPNGQSQRIVIETETQQEAIEAIREAEAAHAPTGFKAKKLNGVTLVIGDNRKI